MSRPKYVAGVFIFDGARVLMVSRDGVVRDRNKKKSPYRDWGLPAGRPRQGETPTYTAQRELYEETGLMAPCLEFKLIVPPEVFNGSVPFFVFGLCGPTHGQERTSTKEGDVAWVTPENILTAYSTLYDSNQLILRQLLGPLQVRVY